ncbi:MAG: hypothetical protein ACD_18C00114G0003 [uncultured bacterium]|nr:MAG: hypothetical protein ACD_18C00114G0003 [uncultured bacterium]OGH84848.1 MAG: hypothetical protein A2488_01710 [Candidatus Magasanikbacteria bacterium RIFOXYC12_FULL_32_21b]OGH91211.1 MAG: hypothetical protein A2507_03975 [Candidatus Magasanikbacteria bacterium RIFOXYD12_FULL_33_17]HAO52732.1 hypothetical protein [Candidatus Magasanikbacteria bacterium]
MLDKRINSLDYFVPGLEASNDNETVKNRKLRFISDALVFCMEESEKLYWPGLNNEERKIKCAEVVSEIDKIVADFGNNADRTLAQSTLNDIKNNLKSNSNSALTKVQEDLRYLVSKYLDSHGISENEFADFNTIEK